MKYCLAILLLLVVGCGGETKEEAIAALEKLGAEVEKDEDGNVVFLNLIKTQISDAGLLHLQQLTNLQTLHLGGNITDAGLVHLKGLTNLQTLILGGAITDAGLAHLKGLKTLEMLGLSKTKVTDAGLEHLKGLTNLSHLSVYDTEVTDAGVAGLQKALPNCKIASGTSDGP